MGSIPSCCAGLGSWALALIVLAGCATRLVPAPGAIRIDGGPGAAAMAEAAGVRVVARVNAWRGYPTFLQPFVTPVLVTIDNGSHRRVQVRHDEFAFVDSVGRRFSALSPFDVHGAVPERVPAAFAAPDLLYAPYPRGFHPYSGFAWGYPYAWDPFSDPFYWDRYATQWVRLPTGDMVQKALPETVLEPGGRVSGFLYFEEVKNVEEVTLRAELLDAATGERFGVAHVPFVVR